MYEKGCIFSASPVILEAHVFKRVFGGGRNERMDIFSNVGKFWADAILSAIWKVRLPCVLEVFKIKE